MTSEVVSWNSRLCVSFAPEGGAPAIISPITNFNVKIETPHEIIDSIDGENLGVSAGNRRYTLDFEVPAMNFAVYRQILNVAVQGAKFSVVFATKSGESDDWYLDAIDFSDCYVNDIDPGSVSNDGKPPVMKVTGICLNVVFSNDGNTLTPTHTVGAEGSL